MSDFELRLLGPFELVHRTKGHLRVRPGRLRALLARLAFRSGRSRTRGDLAGMLWSGRPERAARHSLNQALSELRRTTGSALFVQDGEHLALNSGVITCDIDQVRTLLREGSMDSLSRAVELCRGPFLNGSISGCRSSRIGSGRRVRRLRSLPPQSTRRFSRDWPSSRTRPPERKTLPSGSSRSIP